MPNDGTFDVTVRHSINGRSLGLPKALPVNVYINGALAIPGFEFGICIVCLTIAYQDASDTQEVVPISIHL